MKTLKTVNGETLMNTYIIKFIQSFSVCSFSAPIQMRFISGGVEKYVETVK